MPVIDYTYFPNSPLSSKQQDVVSLIHHNMMSIAGDVNGLSIFQAVSKKYPKRKHLVLTAINSAALEIADRITEGKLELHPENWSSCCGYAYTATMSYIRLNLRRRRLQKHFNEVLCLDLIASAHPEPSYEEKLLDELNHNRGRHLQERTVERQTVINAFRAIYPQLTEREMEILKMIFLGASRRQVSAVVGIHPESVRKIRQRAKSSVKNKLHSVGISDPYI